MQSRKIELKSLEDMEKLFKEEESAVKEAVRDEKYLERALDVLQNGLSGKHPSSKISSWRAKASTLSEEYNKNILILQHEYLKAVISLTGNDFSMPLEQLYPLVQSLRET